jgi:hypothetical protein
MKNSVFNNSILFGICKTRSILLKLITALYINMQYFISSEKGRAGSGERKVREQGFPLSCLVSLNPLLRRRYANGRAEEREPQVEHLFKTAGKRLYFTIQESAVSIVSPSCLVMLTA